MASAWKEAFESINDVRLVPKSESRLMVLFSIFLPESFMTRFWTTYRLPFGKVTIAYPYGAVPISKQHVLTHELRHAEDLRPWYGPVVVLLLATLLPLPFVFSGRWFIERHAYLGDIRRGRRTVDQCVHILWSSYGWAWPRPLMRAWFERESRR